MDEVLNTNQSNPENGKEWEILTNEGQNLSVTEAPVNETEEITAIETPEATGITETTTVEAPDNMQTEESEQANRFEQEATGKDYGNFASEEFGKLMEAFSNPEKQDAETQNQIDAELAVVFSIMSTSNDLKPTKPSDLFDNIRKACHEAADEARENSKSAKAEAYELQSAAADSIENRCHTYLTKVYATATNQAAEANTETAPDVSTDALPGDAIS